VGAHLARAERAVEAEGERLRMAQRVPECRRRLPGQCAPRQIGDRPRDHDRQREPTLGEDVVRRDHRRLGVQRVEDRLDQDQLGAAVDEPPHLLGVGVAHLVERDGAEPWVVDVRREVGRPDGASDEAAVPVLLARDRRRLARKPRAFAVELVDDRLEAVVGLSDRGTRKRVGLDDVGPGAEIVQVDVADGVGLGQDQEVVVALQIVTVVGEALRAEVALRQPQVLDLGPHGAVEHEDAPVRDLADRLRDFGAVDGGKLER
jgi:hypothetical protein